MLKILAPAISDDCHCNNTERQTTSSIADPGLTNAPTEVVDAVWPVVEVRAVLAVEVVAVIGGVGAGGGGGSAGGTKITLFLRVPTFVPVTMCIVARPNTRVFAAGPVRLRLLASAEAITPETKGAAILVPLLVPTRLFGSVELISLPGA